jgi:PTH1 family peptidyl-tRNA hydrolase
MIRSLLDFLFGRREPKHHEEPVSPAQPAAGQALSSGTSLSSAPPKVILGLGNPGPKYERTRHNVGWWVVDHLAEVWRFGPWKKQGEALVATGIVGTAQIQLVKPLTYMNLSGNVLHAYAEREDWSATEDLLVVVDDVALPLGRFRFRARGSAGGHNGLKSIEAALDSQAYARLRIGIAPRAPHERGSLVDYVLGEFGDDEASKIRELLPKETEALTLWLTDGIERTMSRFNQ